MIYKIYILYINVYKKLITVYKSFQGKGGDKLLDKYGLTLFTPLPLLLSLYLFHLVSSYFYYII
jgi:hypothetical protein